MTKAEALYKVIQDIGITDEQLYDLITTAQDESLFFEIKGEGHTFMDDNGIVTDVPLHCAGFEGRLDDNLNSCDERASCIRCPFMSFWQEEYVER